MTFALGCLFRVKVRYVRMVLLEQFFQCKSIRPHRILGILINRNTK